MKHQLGQKRIDKNSSWQIKNHLQLLLPMTQSFLHVPSQSQLNQPLAPGDLSQNLKVNCKCTAVIHVVNFCCHSSFSIFVISCQIIAEFCQYSHLMVATHWVSGFCHDLAENEWEKQLDWYWSSYYWYRPRWQWCPPLCWLIVHSVTRCLSQALQTHPLGQ